MTNLLDLTITGSRILICAGGQSSVSHDAGHCENGQHMHV
jgi:hypothetical protein